MSAHAGSSNSITLALLLACILPIPAHPQNPPLSQPTLPSQHPQKNPPLSFKGILLPISQARMASRAQGVIAEIADEGDLVQTGQTVMRLEDTMEKLQVAQQQHILSLRQTEWNSANELRRKNVVSTTESEEKRITMEVARVQLDQARELLARRSVTAPFNGVVAEKFRKVGEAVDEFVPVLLLADISSLALEIYLPATLLPKIKQGQTVTVQPDLAPEKTYKGHVDKLAPLANPASGDFKVRIIIPNPDRELIAGTQATAQILTNPTPIE